MRGAIFMGVALFAVVVLAVAVGKMVRVVNLFAPAAADRPESVASAAPFPGGHVPAGRAETVDPVAKEVSAGFDEALHSARGTGVLSKRDGPERGALPRGALDQDERPGTAGMKLDRADPGAQVEDLAQKIAPALAREALDHSGDNAARNADVEHELLETWKEQKQILAGQRTTVDSVLKDTPR
jgi:hypothetical protein